MHEKTILIYNSETDIRVATVGWVKAVTSYSTIDRIAVFGLTSC